jgi:hypothetical protein
LYYLPPTELLVATGYARLPLKLGASALFCKRRHGLFLTLGIEVAKRVGVVDDGGSISATGGLRAMKRQIGCFVLGIAGLLAASMALAETQVVAPAVAAGRAQLQIGLGFGSGHLDTGVTARAGYTMPLGLYLGGIADAQPLEIALVLPRVWGAS